MNTSQLYGQRLRPAQETGIEKAKPLLSVQQTSIDNSMDVVIDSSRLVMDNRNSPIGSTENIFARLTQRLVVEFLGGHVKMEELPCLGDLADGNDEFHRITPSPTFSKFSKFKLLDATGNLHLSSILFIDLDFNSRMVDYHCESVLLGSFDASSTTFISSLEQFLFELISQSADHTIEGSHQCSPIDPSVNLKTIAELMTESLCDSEFSETQVFMKSNEFPSGIDFTRAPILNSSNQSDKEDSENPVSMMYCPKDGSNIFDLVKGVRSEVHNSSVNASIIYSTSNGDSVSSMDCIHLENSCNDELGDSNNLATVSTDECLPKFSIPDSKHLTAFLYGNLKFPRFLASKLPDEKLDMFDYPSLHDDSDSVGDENVEDLLDNTFNDQFDHYVRRYDKKTSDTPCVLIGLENGSSKGEYKEIEISNPCYTELLITHWPTVVNSSSFDVSNHEELLESYGFNNQDRYTVTDYTCASPTWPGKVDAAWTEGNQMNLTYLASNEDYLSSFYDENSETSVSSPHLTQRKCTFNTSSSPYSSEDYLSQGHPCSDGFENSIGEPILGTTEPPLVYAIPDPATLNDLYGNLKSPTFLASERMNTNFDRHDTPSFYGACNSNDCADEANSSDICIVELLGSNCSSKDPLAFPFDFIDHYELLESYGLNEQDQYTDDFICESPTWPEKV